MVFELVVECFDGLANGLFTENVEENCGVVVISEFFDFGKGNRENPDVCFVKLAA